MFGVLPLGYLLILSYLAGNLLFKILKSFFRYQSLLLLFAGLAPAKPRLTVFFLFVLCLLHFEDVCLFLTNLVRPGF